MKQLIAIFIVLFMLLACGATAILMARGFFMLRTTSGGGPAGLPLPPTAQSDPLGIAPTPTLAPTQPAGQPAPIGGVAPGGFGGTFAGNLTTANGSAAPATLVLTQNGDTVAARLDIGPGLTVDAGSCGSQAVPAGTQSAAGVIDPAAPNRLQTTGSIPVAGFTIGVVLTADLAADGQTLAARADLDLPFICGVDPVIGGTFARQ